MGTHYDQLDIDERYELYRLHEAGAAVREIGRLMGRSSSTISRELRRNALPRGEYKPDPAARIAMLTLVAKVTQPEVIERFDLRLD